MPYLFSPSTCIYLLINSNFSGIQAVWSKLKRHFTNPYLFKTPRKVQTKCLFLLLCLFKYVFCLCSPLGMLISPKQWATVILCYRHVTVSKNICRSLSLKSCIDLVLVPVIFSTSKNLKVSWGRWDVRSWICGFCVSLFQRTVQCSELYYNCFTGYNFKYASTKTFQSYMIRKYALVT